MAGKRPKTLALTLAAVGLLAAALGAGVAMAAETIEADPVCCTFSKSQFFSDVSEVPVFSNPAGEEGAPHNVVATTKGPDGKPLFRSPTLAKGHSGSVSGTQYLAAGTYNFFCTIHGSTMKSKLVVEQKSAPPVARPKIDVTIPSQTLNKVRSSGKLTVKVKALTQSGGITIEARKGAKRLGTKSGLTLSAGASRTVKVTLTRAGKRALKGLDSATLSAKGSVPFGKPDSASRKLR